MTENIKSYGVYLSHYLSAQTFPGSQPLDYAFIGGFNFGFAMVVSPIVTILARRWGIHVTMLIGTAVLSGGFIAASFATSIVHLYITQGAMVGLGVGFIYIPSIAVLSQWFHRRRSLANGISTTGSGIGGLIFSLATGPMIQNVGYKWSLRIIGILTFVANLLAATFIRDRNAAVRPSQLAFDVKLLRRHDVLLLLSWAFISMLGYMVLLFSLSDFAISIGFSRTQADQLIAFLDLGTAVGRPWVGVASDRFGRIEVAGGLTLLCGVLVLAMWVPSSSFGLTVVFALISGAILGVYWVVSSVHPLLTGFLTNVYEDDRSSVRRSSRAQRGSFAAFHIVVVHRPSNYVYVICSRCRWHPHTHKHTHTLSLSLSLFLSLLARDTTDPSSLRSRGPAT